MRQKGIVIAAALLLAGCGSKPYIKQGFLDHPPQRVAVLPFTISYPYDRPAEALVPEAHAVGRDLFRNAFYQELIPFGYVDLPLETVDQRLTAADGSLTDDRWSHLTPQELGKALEADALIYGDIHRMMHMATPLYTETSLSATLRMVEATSGEVLWRTEVRASERGGALKKGQVVDFLKDQVRSYSEPSVKFQRVADQAVLLALRAFPDPPMAPDLTTAQQEAAEDKKGTVRVAILPLDGRGGRQHDVHALRRHLAASLHAGPFEILELQRVDAALTEHGWKPGEPLPESQVLAEVAKQLGADAWLRGTVTAWGRTYLVLQSWVTAGMRLELIDAQRGEVVWSQTRTKRRQAGILKGPTGWKSLATAPITGLKRSHLDRVAIHVARDLAEKLKAAPEVQAYAGKRGDHL